MKTTLRPEKSSPIKISTQSLEKGYETDDEMDSKRLQNLSQMSEDSTQEIRLSSQMSVESQIIPSSQIYSQPLSLKLMFNMPDQSKELDASNIRELFYMVAMENLSSIFTNGILSHRRVEKQSLRKKDISNNGVQKNREKVIERVESNKRPRKIHRHANFYLQPHNMMMHAMVHGSKDSQDAVAKQEPNDLCILVIHGDLINRGDVVLTDRNAATKSVSLFTKESFKLNNQETNWILSQQACGHDENSMSVLTQLEIEFKNKQQDLMALFSKNTRKIVDDMHMFDQKKRTQYPSLWKDCYKDFIAKLFDNPQQKEYFMKYVNAWEKTWREQFEELAKLRKWTRQAEALAPYKVDRHYIIGAFVNSEEAKVKLQNILTEANKDQEDPLQLDIKVNEELFFKKQFGKLTHYSPIRDDLKQYQFDEHLPTSSSDEDSESQVKKLVRK